jgi:hypothetical protein
VNATNRLKEGVIRSVIRSDVMVSVYKTWIRVRSVINIGMCVLGLVTVSHTCIIKGRW